MCTAWYYRGRGLARLRARLHWLYVSLVLSYIGETAADFFLRWQRFISNLLTQWLIQDTLKGDIFLHHSIHYLSLPSITLSRTHARTWGYIHRLDGHANTQSQEDSPRAHARNLMHATSQYNKHTYRYTHLILSHTQTHVLTAIHWVKQWRGSCGLSEFLDHHDYTPLHHTCIGALSHTHAHEERKREKQKVLNTNK